MPKPKILVVDDETNLVETLKFRLEANNHEVISSYDGKDALAKASKESPDLGTGTKQDSPILCQLIIK